MKEHRVYDQTGEIAVEDELFSATLPADIATDVDGDALTLSVQGVGGTARPAWLDFDAATLTLSGQPPADFNGSIGLELVAFDGTVDTIKAFSLDITPVNDAPVIGDLPGLSGTEDEAFSSTLPAGIAVDVDGDALALDVRSAGGGARPSWLGFDPATLTLSGQPPADFNSVIGLELVASDGTVDTVKAFSLEIAAVNDAPVIGDVPALVSDEDVAFSATLPADIATDVDGEGPRRCGRRPLDRARPVDPRTCRAGVGPDLLDGPRRVSGRGAHAGVSWKS